MLINCHTFYSHTYGTFSVEQLLQEVAGAGYSALALTDINTTCAALDFVYMCRERGLRPLLGIDFRNTEENVLPLYVGLAENNEGFRELNAFLSRHLHTGEPFPEQAPEFANAFFIYPYKPGMDLNRLREREYLGVRPQDITLLIRLPEARLKEKALALVPLSFRQQDDYYLHCLLRAIHHNTLLSKLHPDQAGTRQEFLRTPVQLQEAYARYPFLLRNTEALMERCHIDFDYVEEKNRRCFLNTAEEDAALLRELAFSGMSHKYGARRSAQALAQVEKELLVIADKRFVAYFLTAWDLVKYAGGQGYFHVGRGSGANSIVAYCLGITEVDPLAFDLYFERFLNLHRSSPPDFDIDFSWKDRNDVTQYVFNKYGYEYTALLGAHSTFQFNAAVRELGKVYGLPSAEITRLEQDVKLDARTGSGRAAQHMDQYKQKILHYGSRLIKFPHHLTVHSSGLVVSDVPLHYYTSTSLPPKGFPITHFDMYSADRFKLHKLDILSQRGLGHIRDAVTFIEKNRGEKVNIHRAWEFMNDSRLNDLLGRGDTIGCFYIESPAMRQLLRKLQCYDYRTLVAASSIIRPGVSESGMAKEFVRRHREPDKYQPIHPKIGEILKETYGVMVYQEDIIKVAHEFAGMSLAGADVLRRAMGWKFRVDNGFDQMEKEFFDNCRERGYPEVVIAEVWRQMEGFAGFSFCKAHSASYAVESYQSLFLRTYYPLEFYVAVVNNFGGFYSTEFYLRQAQLCGGLLHAPCVNRSLHLTDLQETDIYLGFIHMKGLPEELAHRLVEEREKNGPYAGLHDLWTRLQPGTEALALLVRIGALRFTGQTKRQLLWEVYRLSHAPKTTPGVQPLFTPPVKTFQIPRLEQSYREDALQEIELLGFPICPRFDLLTTGFRGEVKATDMANNEGKIVTMVGYLHFYRITRTIKGEYMQFGSMVDDENHTFETILFPQVYRQQPYTAKGLYAVTGLIKTEYDVPTLIVNYWESLAVSFDPDVPRPEPEAPHPVSHNRNPKNLGHATTTDNTRKGSPRRRRA